MPQRYKKGAPYWGTPYKKFEVDDDYFMSSTSGPSKTGNRFNSSLEPVQKAI